MKPDVGPGAALATPTLVNVEHADANAMAAFGWFLGNPFPAKEIKTAFKSSATAFWSEHLFDPGDHGRPEILWVDYTNDQPLIEVLETHHRTQQAVVPLTGSIVQILALSGADGAPDLTSIRAYRLTPGIGFCMRPGVWHATRSASATCLMLTRSSTTIELVRHLKHGAPISESTHYEIEPVLLVEDEDPLGADGDCTPAR